MPRCMARRGRQRLLRRARASVYCDATLGGGGHAERILEASAPDGRLVGIDRDPAALAAARARLERFGDRVTLVHGTFGDARAILERLGRRAHRRLPARPRRLVAAARSRPSAASRFSARGRSTCAWTRPRARPREALIARIGVDELADILRRYGEERYAGRIARAIKEA